MNVKAALEYALTAELERNTCVREFFEQDFFKDKMEEESKQILYNIIKLGEHDQEEALNSIKKMLKFSKIRSYDRENSFVTGTRGILIKPRWFARPVNKELLWQFRTKRQLKNILKTRRGNDFFEYLCCAYVIVKKRRDFGSDAVSEYQVKPTMGRYGDGGLDFLVTYDDHNRGSTQTIWGESKNWSKKMELDDVVAQVTKYSSFTNPVDGEPERDNVVELRNWFKSYPKSYDNIMSGKSKMWIVALNGVSNTTNSNSGTKKIEFITGNWMIHDLLNRELKNSNKLNFEDVESWIFNELSVELDWAPVSD